MMNPTLLDIGLNISFEQDELVGHEHRKTFSVRDVPGLTRGVIPLLARRGVVAVSVGENGAPGPVNVPMQFVWRDPATNTSVLALFHPHGYGMWPPSVDAADAADDGPSIR